MKNDRDSMDWYVAVAVVIAGGLALVAVAPMFIAFFAVVIAIFSR